MVGVYGTWMIKTTLTAPQSIQGGHMWHFCVLTTP